MIENTCKAFSPEEFKKFGYELVNQLSQYLTDCQNKTETKVLPWTEPDKMVEQWTDDFSEPHNDYAGYFSRIISQSHHIHHPNYVGHQVTSPLPMAAMVEALGALLNNGQAIYEMGPVPQAMERVVLKWFAKKIGFTQDADGIMTSGGTLGNLTALLAVRQSKVDYNIWDEGVHGTPHPAFMVSEQSHYSVTRAIKVMGLGEKGIVKMPVDENFQIDVSKLESVYQKAVSERKHIIGLVANACSTATGRYDKLKPIAGFCKKHNIWLHVDGAHGAAAILSQKYKHLLNGIEQADSLVVDFHKMFMIPALTTAVVFKNQDQSYQTFAQNASYLLNQDKRWYDSAQRTMECTKLMLSLRIYTALYIHGEKMFAGYIDSRNKLTEDFARFLQTCPDFEMPALPQSNILCFRYVPSKDMSDDEISQTNAIIRENLVKSGAFYIVQAELNGKIYLRTTIINPFTTMSELNDLVKQIRRSYI